MDIDECIYTIDEMMRKISDFIQRYEIHPIGPRDISYDPLNSAIREECSYDIDEQREIFERNYGNLNVGQRAVFDVIWDSVLHREDSPKLYWQRSEKIEKLLWPQLRLESQPYS